MEALEEKECIAAIINGDRQQFRNIVDDNKNNVYSLLLRMMNSQEDAEDVAQDVFVKVFKQLKQFKGKSRLSTWIYKIAYFEGLNALRKQKKVTTTIDQRDFKGSDANVLDMLDAEDLSKSIQDAMELLKPIERGIITLFYLDELSVKEVSEISNKSESNVKVILHRAKKKLFGIMSRMNVEEINILRITG